MADEQVEYLLDFGEDSLAPGLDADAFDAPALDTEPFGADDFDFDDTVVATFGDSNEGDDFGLDGGEAVGYVDDVNEDAGSKALDPSYEAADGLVDHDAPPKPDMTDNNAFEFEITYEDEDHKEGKEQLDLSVGPGAGKSTTLPTPNGTIGLSLSKVVDDESEIGYESEEDVVEKLGQGTAADEMSNIQSHQDAQPHTSHPDLEDQGAQPDGEELCQDGPSPEPAQHELEELCQEPNGAARHEDSTTSHPTRDDALRAQSAESEPGTDYDTEKSACSAPTPAFPDIAVIWNGSRYSLFGNEDDDPDTFFLGHLSALDLPLSEFLDQLRTVISTEMAPSDELAVRVNQLSLQFGQKSPPKFLSRTFREIFACYEKLTINEGAPSSTMVLSLLSLQDCEEHFKELLQHAELGKGLSEVVDFTSGFHVDESSTESALDKDRYDDHNQVDEAITETISAMDGQANEADLTPDMHAAEADAASAANQKQKLSPEPVYGWPEEAEISWEDGDDTNPEENVMMDATALSASLSGKRSRQAEATESLAVESDHKRRRT